MKKCTDLNSLKEVAGCLLYTDVHRVENYPFLVYGFCLCSHSKKSGEGYGKQGNKYSRNRKQSSFESCAALLTLR